MQKKHEKHSWHLCCTGGCGRGLLRVVAVPPVAVDVCNQPSRSTQPGHPVAVDVCNQPSRLTQPGHPVAVDVVGAEASSQVVHT